jgi:transposase
LPPERIDRTETVKPTRCDGCGAALTGEDHFPRRHQVLEIPEPTAEVVEWQLHALLCECGRVTTAKLPEGVPRGNFGPRLQAFVGLLSCGYRLSKRGVQELLHDTFGVTISLGSVTECERAVSEALEVPHAEALAHVQHQPVKHADETGWPEAPRKAYLWTIVTAAVTVFVIAHGRTKELAQSLLGTGGILVSDRLASYHFWPDRRRQFCWAHLKRRFEEFLLSDDVSHELGAQLLTQVRTLFELWYRVRDGTLGHSSFKRAMGPVMRSVKALLLQGTVCADPEVAGTCRELLEHEAALWTFVRCKGVEPTNNASERALRHGVLYRRGSFGTQSERGSRFVERMLTTRATLRAQDRNVMAFVVAACQVRLTGTATPSLLPNVVTRVSAA